MWRAVSRTCPAAMVDLDYSDPKYVQKMNPMNFLSSPGFAKLAGNAVHCEITSRNLFAVFLFMQFDQRTIVERYFSRLVFQCEICGLAGVVVSCYDNLSGTLWLYICTLIVRICIWLVLQCSEDNFFCLLALVCSSWTPVNAGTSKRSLVLPSGNELLAYVCDGNSMCERSLGSCRSQGTVDPNGTFGSQPCSLDTQPSSKAHDMGIA